ncbi:MAG: hypothetical protein AAF799_24995 [Myxococcota bacterium]
MTSESSTPAPAPPRRGKWPTVVVLALLVAATVFNLYSVWGLLFIFWAVDGIRAGETYIVQNLSRTEDAVLFWVCCVTWIGMGLWLVVADVLWRLNGG